MNTENYSVDHGELKDLGKGHFLCSICGREIKLSPYKVLNKGNQYARHTGSTTGCTKGEYQIEISAISSDAWDARLDIFNQYLRGE